jgi:hypothetical protein
MLVRAYNKPSYAIVAQFTTDSVEQAEAQLKQLTAQGTEWHNADVVADDGTIIVSINL